MLQELKELLIGLVEDDEIIPTFAKGFKKLYDNLLAVGFTPDQAMQIVSSQARGVKTK